VPYGQKFFLGLLRPLLISESIVLPKRIPRGTAANIRVAPLLIECAAASAENVFQKLNTSAQGLSEAEAARRWHEHGSNVVAQEHAHPKLALLVRALLNPLVVLLLVLAVLSFLSGDEGFRAGVVMLIMVCLGVVLRFVQEARADTAAAKLRAMISVKATVRRDGQPREVPLAEIVPGDVVDLCAGDMIPADMRLLSCKDLFIIQASMTGEAFPVEKFAACEETSGRGALELKNICYLGTSVESGSASGVIVCTGLETYLGSMSTRASAASPG
jgi:P-type Mg2+ transporter